MNYGDDWWEYRTIDENIVHCCLFYLFFWFSKEVNDLETQLEGLKSHVESSREMLEDLENSASNAEEELSRKESQFLQMEEDLKRLNAELFQLQENKEGR